MKNLILLIASFILLTTGVVSCDGNNDVKNERPGKVIEKFYKFIQENNYEKAAAMYCYKGKKLSEEEIEKMKGIIHRAADDYKSKGGIKEVIIIEETIIGDNKTANVKYNIVYNNGDEDDRQQAFEKIDGKWFMKTFSAIK